jgi:hypothetical protein
VLYGVVGFLFVMGLVVLVLILVLF